MYDPIIGRWLEQDPIGFDAGDMNLYRLEGNNPVNEVDPSGEEGIPPLSTTIREIHRIGWGMALPSSSLSTTESRRPPALGADLFPAMVWEATQFASGREPGAFIRSGAIEISATLKVTGRQFWLYMTHEFLIKKNRPISAMLMVHSLQDCPRDAVFNEKSALVIAVRKSPEYRRAVKEAVQQARESGKMVGDVTGLVFGEDDLGKAIGGFELKYKITKLDDQNADLEVKVIDRYNFELRTYPEIAAFTANNTAWLSQYLGSIKPYNLETVWLQEHVPQPK